MKGNFHVRFLEEEERATALLYSAIRADLSHLTGFTGSTGYDLVTNPVNPVDPV